MRKSMKHICPICNQSTHLDRNDKSFKDYICRTNLDEHVYMYRMIKNVMTQMKVRFTDLDGTKLYFKILYDQDRSEVWTKPNDKERINIGKAFIPDFSDIDKLKQKIKVYLLFS